MRSPQDKLDPPAPGASPPSASGSDGLLALGRLVRERRERLGWSQTRLAERARLARGTLKNLEEALRTPHPDTLECLARVPELRVTSAELQALLAPPPAPAPAAREVLSNLYVDLDPKCDTLVLVRELMDRLAAPVAHIPQTYMYIDPKSADCWCAMAGQASYLAHRDSIPMAQVAAAIGAQEHGDVDVIALGCGDARDEVRLVQHLRQHLQGHLRLFLLDISPPLLGHAHRHAVRTLSDCPGVEVAPPIHGDFFRLPRYRQLLPPAGGPPRRRVVCMFGNTFGNLDNELVFVHESLGALPEGDIFLLQVTEARAPAGEPERVHALDPRLSGQLTPELQQIDRRWLLGIVESYVPEATLPTTRLHMYTQLNMRVCPVPGSYAVETIVEMRVPGAPPRRLSMEYIKRYDSPKLIVAMGELGWDLGAAWPQSHWLLHLYRRRGGEVDRILTGS